MNYPYQDNPSQIDCHTDTDWAGDVATRLSTTAGTLMHGAHWLEGWSVTQKDPFFVIMRDRILLASLWSSARSVDEHILSRSLDGTEENTHASL